MTTVHAASRRMRFLLLPAVLGAVILGILGMHAFTQPEPMPMTPTHQQAAGVEVTGHGIQGMADVNSMTDVSFEARQVGPAAVVEALPASMGDMVMLCGAMLLAAAAGVRLVVRLMWVARARDASRNSVMHVVRTPVALRVGTGPPAVWEFSVIRC